MALKYYKCERCNDDSKPILVENKNAVAVLSGTMVSSKNDFYTVIVLPKKHVKYEALMYREMDSFLSLASKVRQLLEKTVLSADNIRSESGQTSTKHFYKKMFPVRKLDSKELEGLTAKLQKRI